VSQRGQQLRREAASAKTSDRGQQPTCGYLGSPAHASVTLNMSLIVASTAASYTCDNGYEPLGLLRRLRQTNGIWLPVRIPLCVHNIGLRKAVMQPFTARLSKPLEGRR